MMEQQFFEDEFEQFLKQNADQHRMYPSDGVWKTIYRQLHAGRGRIALGTLLLLLLTAIIWLSNTSPRAVQRPETSTGSAPFNSIQTNGTRKSTVTVNDIIEKLRAKSLIPPISIAAPLALSPLHLRGRISLSDTYKVSDTPPRFAYFPPSAEYQLTARTEVRKPIFEGPIQNTQPALQIEQTTIAEPLVRAAERLDLPAASVQQQVNNNLAGLVKIDLPRQSRRKKISYIMSFAPSIGYRNLFDGKNHLSYGSSPLMVRHLNVNQFVDHQPAIGFELGGGIRYQVSRALAIRTGLQLNLTRYSIAAFSHSPEKATLSLNPDYRYQRETVVATSNLRNLVGNDPERLQNQYLQIALPIAAELKLFGDSKLQVNLAGSIQPIYLLNTNQYLLSNDFSNYVKAPSLVRRWNMATSMEAFVSYTTRDIRWQFGPQFRYNLLSTYKKQYPIRENLMEYGVKIGVSKTLH
jgi:hypothetical protein